MRIIKHLIKKFVRRLIAPVIPELISPEIGILRDSLQTEQAKIDALKDSLQVEMKNILQTSFLTLDTIRLDDALFFVPTNDNLYNGFIPEWCKHFDLNAGLPEPKYLSFEEIKNDVTKAMYLYLDVLFRSGIGVYFIDIGSWIGDVGIRYAMFAKTRSADFYAECYDPSRTGELIPYNISLNNIEKYVKYFPLAVSTIDSFQIFSQIWGHSDSSRLADLNLNKRLSSHYIVKAITLSSIIQNANIINKHLIVKLDAEGLDGKIVMQNMEYLKDATIIIEYSIDIGVNKFLEQLQCTHTIFDLYFLNCPTRATMVTDTVEFEQNVKRRDWGYTDILCVPYSLKGGHDEIVNLLGALKPIAPYYSYSPIDKS